MSKKVDNPMLDIEVEFEAEPREISNATDIIGEDEPSLEGLAAEIERRNTKAPEKVEEPTEKNVPVDDPVDDPVDPRFVGKTAEEMIEIYNNLQKLAKKHDTELGELRKANQKYKDAIEAKEEEPEAKEEEIIPEDEDWTDEEKTEWFKLFNKDPNKALKQATDKAMKPYRKMVARNANADEVRRLKTLHKEHVVPYVEKDVNDLIRKNPGWWKTYKGKIFEHAYNEVRNTDFDKYSAIRQKALEEKDKGQEKGKSNTFVEGGAPARIVKSKGITLDQLRAADPDKAMEAIKKMLEANK